MGETQQQQPKPDKGGRSGGKEGSAPDRDLGPYGDRDDQLPEHPPAAPGGAADGGRSGRGAAP